MANLARLYWLLLAGLLLSVAVIRCEDDGEDDEDDGADDDNTQVKEDEGVYVLTNNNFDDFVAQHDIVLVEFYAPWCGHCKTLAPEYAEAAKRLKEADIPVPLAKVDATENQELAGRYDVKGYPTLKYKIKDQWYDYEGPREEEGIVKYMQEKSDPNFKPPPESVVTVTEDNFEDFKNSADLVLVEFYAPWCGHCKSLAPEFEKAAKTLLDADPAVPLGKVDATVEKDLASQFGVSGYPTLKMFRKGKPFEYNGPREEHGIVDYMIGQSGDAAKFLPEVSDVRKTVETEKVMVVGFFDNLEAPELALFHDVANERREDLRFGYTLSEAARNRYKVNPGSVVVFTPEIFQTKWEPKYHVLNTVGKTKDDISQHVVDHQTPLVGQYQAGNTDKFYVKKDILCLAFYTVDFGFAYRDNTQIWRNKYAEVAKDYPDISFAIANEDEYESMLKEFGLDDTGEDFNIGCLMKKRRYPMEAMDEFDADLVREFLTNLKKGKLAPHIKSAPVPKKKSGPITVVVGKTFDKIVKDKSKDVLIELYAPWCGHCKQLEPVYKDLAKQLKKEKNLVIAKMDATANDAPEEYSASGFPTIYFAPANSKDVPLTYSGGRTADEMKTYLKEHATVSFGKSLKDEL